MAETISLKHKETGMTKTGVYGWSWTTFLFGPFPALFRADFLTFFGYNACAIIVFFCSPLGWLLGLLMAFIWPAYYNEIYTRKLLNSGYRLAGTDEQNQRAIQALHIYGTSDSSTNNPFVASSSRKCPFCAEMVKAEAVVCRFCQRDLPQEGTSSGK